MDIMDITTEITQIIPLAVRLVFAVLGVLLLRYILPWIKQQVWYGAIKWLVNAAEKLAESGQISKDYKKRYVLRLMQLLKIPVNDFTSALIEAAVKELDMLEDKIKDYFDNESDELPEGGDNGETEEGKEVQEEPG